jgi:hypothetical protein
MAEMFFATLILLSLKRLVFMVKDGRLHLPVPWPGPQFLSLSERSSFPSHLASLLLYNVAISERELLQTLAIFSRIETPCPVRSPRASFGWERRAGFAIRHPRRQLVALTRTPIPRVSSRTCTSSTASPCSDSTTTSI